MATTTDSTTNKSQFRWLQTVDESFELMLAAIDKATTSIRLEMYIYAASPIGERFRDALVRACERGLRVKVLIDAWGSMTLPDRFWDPLRNAGGQLRWFNPLTLHRWGIRNHRKLLVCDESLAFVGGFNISTEYEGDGVTKGWHDLGIQVEGILAKELASSFETLFGLADFQHKRFVTLRKTKLYNLISTQDGQILLTGPGRQGQFLKKTLQKDLENAKSIRIISAYFLPTRPIRRALIRAARHGSRVQIILAAKSDVPMSQAASRRFYQTFLKAGIEIHEYQPQILHSKLFLVDQVVYVGSANLDRRSFYINYELMLRLTNRELASETSASFDIALSRCQKIDPITWRKSRSLWSKIRETWAFFILARVDPFLARRQLRNLR